MCLSGEAGLRGLPLEAVIRANLNDRNVSLCDREFGASAEARGGGRSPEFLELGSLPGHVRGVEISPDPQRKSAGGRQKERERERRVSRTKVANGNSVQR